MSQQFNTAVEFALSALYENGAAKDIVKSLKSAQDRVDGLADNAYRITEIVDERTDGQVPDEEIAFLGAEILEEVVDIGEAAGLKYTPQEIAAAFKQMILRFLQEQGADTRQLETAMDQVDPSVFDKMAEES